MTETAAPTEPVRAPRFAGKRAVVTGAAGGLGSELAALLRAEGATVVGLDVTAAEGVAHLDLTDPASITAAAQAAAATLGGVDVLCHVAGTQQFGRLETLTPEGLALHLAVNTTGPVLLTQALLPHLTEARGNVVAVTSISAVMGQPYNVAYCASKAGLLLAMRSLAVELADRGIRVNCVSPGGIDTDMVQRAAHALPADVDWNLIAKSQSVIPGMMPPLDVAEAVAFLASPAAASITGANLVVDRGVVW